MAGPGPNSVLAFVERFVNDHPRHRVVIEAEGNALDITFKCSEQDEPYSAHVSYRAMWAPEAKCWRVSKYLGPNPSGVGNERYEVRNGLWSRPIAGVGNLVPSEKRRTLKISA